MRYRYGTQSAPEQLELVRRVLAGVSASRLDGGLVAAFEDGVAVYTESRHAVAVASGTIAIQLALAGLGVTRDDEVVVPEFAWVSVGAAVAAVGARVVVAPCRQGLAPTWDDIEPLLTSATGAVLVAHMRGVPALDIGRIAAELGARGIPLVEDCSQAWGVRLDGRHVGAWGRVATLSTQAYKLVATGEGGFVVTDDDAVATAVSRASGNPTESTDLDQWAGNARMTELQAAIGLPQLAGLEELIGRLGALQVAILEILGTLPGVERTVPMEPELSERNGRSNGTWAGLWATDVASAQRLVQRLRAAGVAVVVGGAPDDRHWSGAWPSRVTTPRVDPGRWVELPMPDATPREHDALLERVASAAPSGRRRPATSPTGPDVAVAIVGCGDASRWYRPTLLEAGIRVVACADADAARAAELASDFGAAPQTVDQVVANDDVDLVVNLTPPKLHAPLSRMFLEAGKGVYSEKPLAVSADEAAALVELATERRLLLACAPETALDPRWDALVHLLQTGLIGQPTGAAVDLVNDPAAWHPRPGFLYEPGGGPLWDLGPYGLTTLTLLFGPVSVVTGRARTSASQGPVATDIRALLDFHSGFAATMGVSYDRPVRFGPPLGVSGTEGVAQFTGSGLAYEGDLQVCKRIGDPWTTIPIERHRVRGLGVVDLVDALAAGRHPRLDAGTALHVVEVIEAIERSCASGDPVVVNGRARPPCGAAPGANRPAP